MPPKGMRLPVFPTETSPGRPRRVFLVPKDSKVAPRCCLPFYELRRYSDFRSFRSSIPCLLVPLSMPCVQPRGCPTCITRSGCGSLGLSPYGSFFRTSTPVASAPWYYNQLVRERPQPGMSAQINAQRERIGTLFVAQRDHGIDARRPPRRNPTREQGNQEQQQGHSCKGRWIRGADLEKLRPEPARQR